MRDALEAAEWRLDIEGLPFEVPLQKKGIFVEEVALHFTVLRAQGMLDQFINGLKYYEVCGASYYKNDNVGRMSGLMLSLIRLLESHKINPCIAISIHRMS